MTEEMFIRALSDNLKYLKKKVREEELNKYRHLNDYNLDPMEIANSIYQSYGLTYRVHRVISLKEAAGTIIEGLQSKNNKVIKNVLLFFLYLLLLLIVIKIPFIYVRDTMSSILGNLFSGDFAYMIWGLLFEALYAVATILIFIRLIKNKAIEIEKELEKNVNET
ncbi:MAG: hypothetical protein NC483_04630 [Ruminococcus sp.]|nr:hypothetical protein [Ruminococcus sp.]